MLLAACKGPLEGRPFRFPWPTASRSKMSCGSPLFLRRSYSLCWRMYFVGSLPTPGNTDLYARRETTTASSGVVILHGVPEQRCCALPS